MIADKAGHLEVVEILKGIELVKNIVNNVSADSNYVSFVPYFL